MLAVTLSKDARARAVQLPAWNEALGLPRPWDQQWSLRIQQVLAHESDLLEYEDIFDGLARRRGQGRPSWSRSRSPRSTGSRRWAARWPPSSPAISSRSWSPRTPSAGPGSSPARRRSSASTCFETTEPNPLTADLDTAIMTVDPAERGPGGRRAARAGATTATQPRVATRARWRWRLKEAAAGHRQPDGGDPGVRPRRRHDRRVGLGAARGLRRVPRPDRASSRRPVAVTAEEGTRAGRRSAARSTLTAEGPGRRQAAAAGRQAGPGRALQRRRADRRTGPRRRLRGGLPGHPAHARADRRRRPSPRTCTASACRSCPARTPSWCRTCWSGCARPGRTTSR